MLRIVTEAGMPDLESYLAARAVERRIADGRAVRATRVEGAECELLLSRPGIGDAYRQLGGRALVEHDLIGFVSYPYEWPAEMLYRAGVETIELAAELVDEGLGLKDATPLNVLYRGWCPVFVDALSVERRRVGDQRWLGYAQFVRTFVLPLAVNRDFGIPLGQIFLSRRDGLEPEEVYRLLGPLRRLSRDYFGLVTMPRMLGERRAASDGRLYEDRLERNGEKARYVLKTVLEGLRSSIERVRPRGRAISVWSDYMSGNNNYSDEQFQAKERFVGEALALFKPGRVLDVGCNNGHFSAQAARAGGEVVAIDYDPVVAGQLYRSAEAGKLNIQPMVVDLTRPSPSCGWNNGEFPAFLDRARGRFDTVLMLAVIHHMLVTERVPLDSILDMAGELTTATLVIEYVSPADSMFKRLARGRDHLHQGLTSEVFEASLGRHFEIVRKEPIAGAERILYLLRKRS